MLLLFFENDVNVAATDDDDMKNYIAESNDDDDDDDSERMVMKTRKEGNCPMWTENVYFSIHRTNGRTDRRIGGSMARDRQTGLQRFRCVYQLLRESALYITPYSCPHVAKQTIRRTTIHNSGVKKPSIRRLSPTDTVLCAAFIICRWRVSDRARQTK